MNDFPPAEDICICLKSEEDSNERYDMKGKPTMEDQLMQRATDSINLSERAGVNQSYGENDFNGRVDELSDAVRFSSVLDICCGTGNQLVKYTNKNKKARIVGVDISKESLQTAGRGLHVMDFEGYTLHESLMEDVFGLPEVVNDRFDLISCFYGLYYSNDVTKTVNNMIEMPAPKGALLKGCET